MWIGLDDSVSHWSFSGTAKRVSIGSSGSTIIFFTVYVGNVERYMLFATKTALTLRHFKADGTFEDMWSR